MTAEDDQHTGQLGPRAFSQQRMRLVLGASLGVYLNGVAATTGWLDARSPVDHDTSEMLHEASGLPEANEQI